MTITNLPGELVANVLSRLPIKTILHCRGVCKRWRSILSEPYFADIHLSRSPEGLIIHPASTKDDSDVLKLCEIYDKPDQHDVHYDSTMRFDLGLGFNCDHLRLSGSVNGLICLWHYKGSAAYICNPITREYIHIPYQKCITNPFSTENHGFGYVKATNEYKIVRFYLSEDSDCKLMCEIYTLGTGTWRSLGHVPFKFSIYHDCTLRGHGIFVGGDLHWLICDPKNDDNFWRCSLDLEKEKFHLTAYVPGVGEDDSYRSLGELNGCLCLTDIRRKEYRFVIWVMEENGKNESWSKKIVIRDDLSHLHYEAVYPLKVLKDGTILLMCLDDCLYTYHPRTKILQKCGLYFGSPLQKLDILSGLPMMDAMVFVPSFIRLRSFMLEKTSAF